MRYVVRLSYIDVLGGIWWPYGAQCSLRKELSSYDINNIKAYGDGRITRDAIDHWLALNSGDFSAVTDWRASIEAPYKDGRTRTITYNWKHEESEDAYLATLGEEE